MSSAVRDERMLCVAHNFTRPPEIREGDLFFKQDFRGKLQLREGMKNIFVFPAVNVIFENLTAEMREGEDLQIFLLGGKFENHQLLFSVESTQNLLG